MPKPMKQNLSNMEIDEISLVDKGANQHALVTITKRAPEEDAMPEEFELYTANGELLAQDATLSDGDIVYDKDGNAYEYSLGEAEVEAEAKELETVGKSAFFQPPAPVADSGFAKSIMEELSKAFGDDERDAVITKALGHIAELERRQEEIAKAAKAERDLRLTSEYISKAAEYNLPVNPAELGPVLFRMAETMSYEDCSVIAKCLETAGTALFQEVGYIGGGANDDVMDVVTKSIEGERTPEAVTKAFDNSPQAYDEYLASRGR